MTVDSDHHEMISFGAGVNSVAMTIMLVNDGWRGPIVFADPGAEHPDTYCYLEMFERDWCKPRGLGVTRIAPDTHQYLYGPRYQQPLEQMCLEHAIVPTMHIRWCTSEYKRRPLQRYSGTIGISLNLLGIAADESHRAAKDNARMGIEADFPLINRRISREQCKQIIRDAGLPVPVKSGCWFCPFQRASEWRAVYDLRPDLFDRAVAMEQNVYEKRGRAAALGGDRFNRSLALVKEMWDRQMELPGLPEPEYAYQMCECRL